MNELELTITERDNGWLGSWRFNGDTVGDEITMSASAIGPFQQLTKQLDEVFGRTDREGYGRLSLFPPSALEGLGQNLYSIWCTDVWPSIFDSQQDQPTRLLVRTDCQTALNLPWELLPSGANKDDEYLGCQSSWSVYRTPLDPVDHHESELRAGPLRVLFLTAAPTINIR